MITEKDRSPQERDIRQALTILLYAAGAHRVAETEKGIIRAEYASGRREFTVRITAPMGFSGVTVADGIRSRFVSDGATMGDMVRQVNAAVLP